MFLCLDIHERLFDYFLPLLAETFFPFISELLCEERLHPAEAAPATDKAKRNGCGLGWQRLRWRTSRSIGSALVGSGALVLLVRLGLGRPPDPHRVQGGTSSNYADHVLAKIAADNYISKQQTGEQSMELAGGVGGGWGVLNQPLRATGSRSNSHLPSSVTQLFVVGIARLIISAW